MSMSLAGCAGPFCGSTSGIVSYALDMRVKTANIWVRLAELQILAAIFAPDSSEASEPAPNYADYDAESWVKACAASRAKPWTFDEIMRREG